jgi:hypothetical protein
VSAVLASRLRMVPLSHPTLTRSSRSKTASIPFPGRAGTLSIRSLPAIWSGAAASPTSWSATCTDDGRRRGAPAQPQRRREAAGRGIWCTPALPRHEGGASGRGDELVARSAPVETSALALYRHFGFQQIGVRRGYYPAEKGSEDALVMRHVLGGYRHDRQQPACEPTDAPRLLREIGLSPHWQLRESAVAVSATPAVPARPEEALAHRTGVEVVAAAPARSPVLAGR